MKSKTALCLVVIVAILATTVSGLVGSYSEGFADGERDGWEDSDALRHFVSGFTLSVFYVGFSLIDPPASPPAWRMKEILSESDEYQKGYLVGYEKGWQSCRIRNAVGGAVAWGFFLVIIASIVGSA